MKDKKVVKVPHFVAEWIDYKIGHEGLEGVLDFVWAVHGVMTYEYTGKRETSTDLAWWLFGYNSNTHSEILLDAWLNGCEAEEELGILLLELEKSAYKYVFVTESRGNPAANVIYSLDRKKHVITDAKKVTKKEAEESYPQFKWVPLSHWR